MAFNSDPKALPICNSGATAGVATGTLESPFLVCSGTPGNNYGGPDGPPGLVPNDEDSIVRTYNNFFNSMANDPKTPKSPCINTFTPIQSSADPYTFVVKPGATGSALNETSFSTGSGCCTRLIDYEKVIASGPAASAELSLATIMPTPNDRVTRLTRFSTDTFQADGTRNYGGEIAAARGVPADLWGMTKVWGVSPTKWLHGGVHADNVGAWNAGKDGFVIKCGTSSWKQQYVLWCRMTGDKYDLTNDPYGTICPAPNGSYITPKTIMGPQNPFSGAVDSTGMSMKNPCAGCGILPSDGQIYANPEADKPTGYDPAGLHWNHDEGTSCLSPYIQNCNMASLSDDICKMADASPIVGVGGITSYQSTDNGGFPGYTAKSRVGGCFTSRDMYGPGKFSVVANLPPTLVNPTDFIAEEGYPVPAADGMSYGPSVAGAAGMSGGRGYVFTMWTFSYTEAYLPPQPKVADASGGDPTVLVVTAPYDASAPADGSGPNPQRTQNIDANNQMVDTPIAVPVIPGISSGTTGDGFYTMHNAEIDIEIPSNTGQVANVSSANQKLYSGLDTANFNTWVTDTDTDSYNAGTRTLYQQAQATSTAINKQFFASVGPADDENTYHDFSFVWYVDPTQETMPTDISQQSTSYVAFYRDGVEIFKCHRFVPRRSGRVVIGMWPAWWGSIRNPMTYNQVYCKIARLEFTPQCDISDTAFPGGALVTNAPQMYDQAIPMADGSYNEIKCGFGKPMTFRAAVPYPATAQFCKTGKTAMAEKTPRGAAEGKLGGLQKPNPPLSSSSPLRNFLRQLGDPAKSGPGSNSSYPTWVLPVVISVGGVVVLALVISIVAIIMMARKRRPQ